MQFIQVIPFEIKVEEYAENQSKGKFHRVSKYYISINPTLEDSSDIDIDQSVLHYFVDAAHATDLHKQCSTKGLVFTFCGELIVYKSKTQTINAGNFIKIEFIAAYIATRITIYLCIILKQLDFKQTEPTIVHIDNMSAIQMINDNTSSAERCCDLYIWYWEILE